MNRRHQVGTVCEWGTLRAALTVARATVLTAFAVACASAMLFAQAVGANSGGVVIDDTGGGRDCPALPSPALTRRPARHKCSSLLSQGEYGATEGLPRIMALYDRYNIPGSFYVPAVTGLLYPEMGNELTKRPRHEIGSHGSMRA